MCECWEFNCGHKTTVECQDYGNRFFTNANIEVNHIISDEDDPFTDTGVAPSTVKESNNVKEQRTRTHSNSSPIPPPQFLLPLSTPSPVKSDPEAAASAGKAGRDSLIGNSDPGPTIRNTGSLDSPKLPLPPFNKISVCGGAILKKKKVDNECYTCILTKTRSNATFQKDERAALTRIYEELKRRENTSKSTEQRGNNRSGPGTGGTEGGSQAYRHHAVDLGRGNPPQGPRRGSSAPTVIIPDFPYTYNAARPAPQPHQPQAQNMNMNYGHLPYQGRVPSPTISMIYTPSDAGMAYQNEGGQGKLPQYAVQTNVNQYLQAQQQQNNVNQYLQAPQQQRNPEQSPLVPYGTPTPSQYQQYRYPQTETEIEMEMAAQMQYQYQYQGNPEGEYEQYGYPQMDQIGYVYFDGI